ncbi:MAG: urea carboxylase [Opitutales bacterium]
MFKKVLIANRGEIACRIIRTLSEMGIESVAVYSEADADAPHVSMATEAFLLGPAAVSESYLRIERILEIAKQSGAEAIHPGYGLLSENADFATQCEAQGIAFVGPTPGQMLEFGLKHEARRLAEENQVPLLPGSDLLSGLDEALSTAENVGYPVMLKSTAGGGGIGMQICGDAASLCEAYDRVERLSQSHFGQGGIFLEKYVTLARHLEVQIFGDGAGSVVSLGVRDCSAQRRNQKVIEETPPPNVPDSVVSGLEQAALRLARGVSYRSAGTVEFIYDNDTQEYYFLEVNTRLQVEHGVSELVTGVDLVRWMVEQAAGELSLPNTDSIPQKGHAIQTRLYAEDPHRNFQPSSGTLTHVEFPEDVRCDHWIASGSEITPYYDPLLAKLQVYADDRPSAVDALQKALSETRIDGLESNLAYLRSIVADDVFCKGTVVTRSLGEHTFRPRSFEVLRSGTMTTVQDFPGRVGYWDVGVPPSGPMDNFSFRLGNRMLGNSDDAAGLEITATGPKLSFNFPTRAVLTGAPMSASLDGQAVEFNNPFDIREGAVLDVGSVLEAGVRAYLLIQGGLDIPKYLGSRSTFTLGKFGGHGGRALRVGDVIHMLPADDSGAEAVFTVEHLPEISTTWDIAVLSGPHGAPDFFTERDITEFFETDWKVHFNSARTGVRLIGPKPEWARPDGGEAGLHPSNLHDNAYSIGAVDFTGDMPVILGPDGPSLGGFVCPVTIIECELWKMGQLRPGDSVRFRCLSPDEAKAMTVAYQATLEEAAPLLECAKRLHYPSADEAILHSSGSGDEQIVVRRAGDTNVLVEIGPMALDFRLRFHIHVLYEAFKKREIVGVSDLTPGIRSLQVHFDPKLISAASICEAIVDTNASLPALENVTVPSRVVHLPLSWDDPSTQEAIDRYVSTVRADAPWCPDNIEFIRRINGLDSRQDVYDIVFNARYVVLGLGDVYLGAPVATPMDPRHRLVTTKYNPARTWTPENAVGIGGAYMCIYGMEGPGGYQFVGRTIQMWNSYDSEAPFEVGKPWLLRFFDQIRFYPVSEDELKTLRKDFPAARFSPKIEEGHFSLSEYQGFLDKNSESIAEFKSSQKVAFEAERKRWEAAGIAAYIDDSEVETEVETASLPEGAVPVESPVAGSLWKILANEEGAEIEEGDTLAILESMKMEIQIAAPASGTLCLIASKEGQTLDPGQLLFAIQPK